MKTNQPHFSHTCANGLKVIAEKKSHSSSIALSLLVPIGAAYEKQDKKGSANLLIDMFFKGAGSWNNVELSTQYEDIGVRKGFSSGIEVSTFSMAMLPENFSKALSILRTNILEPSLPESELENVKSIAFQDLKSIEDEPSSFVMQELVKEFYPSPHNSSQIGNAEGIKNTSIDDIKNLYNERFKPSNSILAISGNFNWEEIITVIEKEFSDWKGESGKLETGKVREKSFIRHIERDTSQVQIAIAYPSLTNSHDDLYVAKVANSVLSGGMAGRLFVEVREKRGLVYNVSSSHSSNRLYGAVFASAGTTPENAQETFDVMLEQLSSLEQGATEDELKRAKADLKSKLIMRSDLNSSRVSSIINDTWNLERVRSLEELKTGIDSVKSEDIIRYSKEFRLNPLTVLSLGKKSISYEIL